MKTRASNLLKKVVKFRKMTWPAHQACLSIPFMSHASFSASVDRWLKSLSVQHFRPLLAPLHLPSARVRETALQSCKDLVHNVPIWDRSLLEHGRTKLPCSCSSLQLPDECFADGHLAAGIEQLENLHPDLWYLGQGSANSTFFPSKTKFFADASQRFDKWRRIHGFPASVVLPFNAFLQEQWSLHEQCVKHESRLCWQRVQNCKKALQDVV